MHTRLRPAGPEFAELTGGYRRELLAFCYRMTGSVQDAEDLVQETYLRAWRGYPAFEGRSSMRTYLYRVATNACLSALERRSRRVMPTGRGAGQGGVAWLEPAPDDLIGGDPDPATVVDARAGVRLAFVAALQHLSPLRRAVLILRDVLAMPAAAVADLLGTTTAAVNSALPRARAQIAQAAPEPAEIAEPAEPHRQAIVDSYVSAFEKADVDALARLFRADITLEMPPLVEWYQGREPVTGFFAGHVLDRPDQFRMVPTRANGQPAVLAYRREGHDRVRPHAVHVLTLDRAGIVRIAVFLDPEISTRFAHGSRDDRAGEGMS